MRRDDEREVRRMKDARAAAVEWLRRMPLRLITEGDGRAVVEDSARVVVDRGRARRRGTSTLSRHR
jgi:hypothetical protein